VLPPDAAAAVAGDYDVVEAYEEEEHAASMPAAACMAVVVAVDFFVVDLVFSDLDMEVLAIFEDSRGKEAHQHLVEMVAASQGRHDYPPQFRHHDSVD